ncbi:MAG: formylglycine-generating enzyme family protein [Anaerolineae bacterium]|nr:formylglycine-generating enzyme family protein [Anaerolineae bacterium]
MPTPEPPGNADWSPVNKTFGGVEMVEVPPGCFPMGSTDAQIDAAVARCEASGSAFCKRHTYEMMEQPVHEVCFTEPFFIDRYEVTNAQFAELGGVAAKESRWADPDLPRTEVTWFEARDFCALRGARLPTEAEWEYAARGPSGWVFPWGDDPDGTRVNFCDTNCPHGWKDVQVDDGFRDLAPVGAYPDGASWVGALDLSGNAWEWTNSRILQYPYVKDTFEADTGLRTDVQRTIRGGSAYGAATLASRSGIDAGTTDFMRSFRCARSN